MSDIPQVFSQQIDDAGPVLKIEEGDSATVTCEKPISETTEAYWILAGSDLLQNETQLINNTVGYDELRNGMLLNITHNSSVFNNGLKALASHS